MTTVRLRPQAEADLVERARFYNQAAGDEVAGRFFDNAISALTCGNRSQACVALSSMNCSTALASLSRDAIPVELRTLLAIDRGGRCETGGTEHLECDGVSMWRRVQRLCKWEKPV